MIAILLNIQSQILTDRNYIKCLISFFFGLGFTSHQDSIHVGHNCDNFTVLLVKEDLKCSSMHYFRHKGAPE
jgi:hypothetical protein